MLSDRAWQIIGVLAGLVALVVTIATFFYGELKGKKRLEATLISQTSLMNPPAGSTKKGLQITYEGKPIPDLALFQLQFRNAGRQPIVKSDFEEPIKIQTAGVDQVIRADKLTAIPPELSPDVRTEHITTIIEGALLNPDDQFTIEIAAVPTPGAKPSVQPPAGRITGVKNIEFQPRLKTSSAPVSFPITVLVSVVATILAAAVYLGIQKLGQLIKLLFTET